MTVRGWGYLVVFCESDAHERRAAGRGSSTAEDFRIRGRA
jgi:hypothetical protein